MASILSENPSVSNPQTTDPVGMINTMIGQILNSANPKLTFQQVVSQNQEAQNAMNLINQYGNGDPKQAFLNYANQTGKQNLAREILQKFGLG